MLLHILFILKRRIDVIKIVTDLKLVLEVWIDFIRGVTNVARSQCCTCSGKSRSRRKVCRAERYMCRVVFWNRSLEDICTFIWLAPDRQGELHRQLSVWTIFCVFDFLERLASAFVGRAINYVNQKRHWTHRNETYII